MKTQGLSPKRSGLAILAVTFVATLIGDGWLIGQGAYYRGPAFRLIGAGILLGAVIVLAITVKQWAGYICALCLITTIKALLALIFGVTISSAHLTTNRGLISELLLLLTVLTALAYRFTVRLPRSKLEVVALVAGVIGLALDVVMEPNFWPLKAAIALLALSWIVDRMTRRNFPHHDHPGWRFKVW